MSSCLPDDAIHVRDFYLWAHVGVLEEERHLGQWFCLDFSLWLDVNSSAMNDELSQTVDYSLAISDIQELASNLECLTIEHFSEMILARLECLYGSLPMRLLLRKCAPPVPGFSGSVAVERHRYWPSE